MTVGFQCFNTAGGYQIDGVYPQFAFKRKLTVACPIKVQESSNVPYWVGDFDISSGEIAAIVSNTDCAIIRRMNGTARLAVTALNRTVTVYIFGQVLPVASNFGFQVFNAAGTLVFDAAQKPLAMVGFPVGEGNFTYNVNRKYAAVVMNQWLKVESEGHDYGNNNIVKITMGMIREIAGGITINNILMSHWEQAMDPNQSAFDQSVPVYSPNRHIIIDVTNY
jgi:hypothetical protein